MGLEAFKASEFDHKAGDAAVRGLDRDATQMLAQLVVAISTASDEIEHQAIANANKAFQFSLAAMLAWLPASARWSSLRCATSRRKSVGHRIGHQPVWPNTSKPCCLSELRISLLKRPIKETHNNKACLSKIKHKRSWFFI